jgi:hypothetical protein
MPGTDNADEGWDNYQERVLRNEGRLHGLEVLVAETRQADQKLIDERSRALAQELERRADAVLELVTARADAILTLSKEEREADRREVASWVKQHESATEQLREGIRREGELSLKLLREMYDGAIAQLRTSWKDGLDQNMQQSQAAIHELELRRQAATEKVEQMVRQWRESDREAREIFAHDTQRHLESLNHNNERVAHILASTVTRELWQSEKDATMTRENILRDQLIALDRVVLTMTPQAQSDKAHKELLERSQAAIDAQARTCDTRFQILDEKINELRAFRDTATGRSTGYAAFYGWGVAALGALATVVVLANIFLGKG